MKTYATPAGKWLKAAKWWLEEKDQHMHCARCLCGCLTCLESWLEAGPDDDVEARVDLARQVNELNEKINYAELNSIGFEDKLAIYNLAERADKAARVYQ